MMKKVGLVILLITIVVVAWLAGKYLFDEFDLLKSDNDKLPEGTFTMADIMNIGKNVPPGNPLQSNFKGLENIGTVNYANILDAQPFKMWDSGSITNIGKM